MNLEIFYIFIPEFCPANGGVQVKGGENLSSESDRHRVQICLSAQGAHVTDRMKDRGNVHLSAGDDN